ncbi:MAG: hypothetical protein M3313_02205 [Actinomycetota bacterium]|nr:hypothetical protein [Actinomycetota bacterium]
MQRLDYATQNGDHDFDAVEWDEGNLDHATKHGASAEEIEQAISNATEFRRSKHHSDRRRIEARTDEGRDFVVIIQLLGSGRARPITAWEAT